MSEKIFTPPTDSNALRRFRVLQRGDVSADQPAADDELRAALVIAVDCLIRRFGTPPNSAELPEQLWTAGQIAAWLQIPETTILEYARDGKIPSVRVGKHVRFDPHAVMKALA